MSHYTYVLYVLCEDDDLRGVYNVAESHNLNTGKDSGFDVFVPENTVITPGSVSFVNQKIKCKMVKHVGEEEEPTGFYLYPRSSISKTPLMMANSVGIIDSGYRGPIIAALRNMDSIEPYVLSKHQRLVQICAPNLSPFKIVFVSELDDTERGSGGFGSTGK